MSRAPLATCDDGHAEIVYACDTTTFRGTIDRECPACVALSALRGEHEDAMRKAESAHEAEIEEKDAEIKRLQDAVDAWEATQ